MVQYPDVHLCKELHQNSQQILKSGVKYKVITMKNVFPAMICIKERKKKQIINAIAGMVEEIFLQINFNQRTQIFKHHIPKCKAKVSI